MQVKIKQVMKETDETTSIIRTAEDEVSNEKDSIYSEESTDLEDDETEYSYSIQDIQENIDNMDYIWNLKEKELEIDQISEDSETLSNILREVIQKEPTINKANSIDSLVNWLDENPEKAKDDEKKSRHAP